MTDRYFNIDVRIYGTMRVLAGSPEAALAKVRDLPKLEIGLTSSDEISVIDTANYEEPGEDDDVFLSPVATIHGVDDDTVVEEWEP